MYEIPSIHPISSSAEVVQRVAEPIISTHYVLSSDIVYRFYNERAK